VARVEGVGQRAVSVGISVGNGNGSGVRVEAGTMPTQSRLRSTRSKTRIPGVWLIGEFPVGQGI